MKNIKLLVMVLNVIFLLWSNLLLAQSTDLDKTIKGTVLNEFGQPVYQATVSEPFSLNKVYTAIDGTFMISVPLTTENLYVEYAGYHTQKPDIKANTGNIQAKLIPDVANRDEILSVALMQKESRESYTGSLSTVKGEELAKTPSSGMSEALAGRLAGLTAIQSSSEPGSDGASLTIRGYHSVNGSSPLIVLDGIPAPTLDINTINVNTIESVTVLKDASATALYGYKGSCGVILINTKRGEVGKTNMNVTTDFSVSQFSQKPYTTHSWEYATLRNEALKNDGLDPLFSTSDIESFKNGTDRVNYPDNDWYNMFVKDFTTMQRYNVSLTGGNQRMKYYVNAGYMDQEGMYKVSETDKYDPNYYLKRFSIRSNIDAKLLNNLSCFLNIGLTIDRNNQSNTSVSNILSSIVTTPSYVPGPLTDDGRIVTVNFLDYSTYGRINRSGSCLETSTDSHINYGMNLNMDFVTPGLSLMGQVSYQSRYVGDLYGSRNYARYVRNTSVDSLAYTVLGSNTDTPLSFSKGSTFCYYMNFQSILKYQHTFARDHEIDAFVSYFNQDMVGTATSTLGMLPYDYISFAGHAKYGYKSKYYLQGDFSYCGSQDFAADKRYGFFPTISASWIASKEDFLKDLPWLNFLKFRASYGSLGSDQMPSRFLYRSNITQSASGLVNGIYTANKINENSFGNSDLTYETSLQQNYGFDFSFLNDFSLIFDYWKINQSGMVIQSDNVPAYQGISLDDIPYQNLGKMEDKGFDLTLNYMHKFNKDFMLSFGGVFGYNKNTITYIQELNRSSSGYTYPYRSTGYSIGQHFGYLIDYSNGNGYYNSQEELDNSNLEYSGTAPRVGDFVYKDLNSDGLIDERDKAPIGNPTFPRVSYGFNVRVNYKNFDLYAQFQGIDESSYYFSGAGIMENAGYGVYNNLHREAWTAERYAAGVSIKYPALTTTSSSSLTSNDFFISDQNYIRLKNVEFGFSLPVSITNKLGIQKLRIYLSGENLLTFTDLKFERIDPENASWTSYPISRTYNIGLNLNF